MPTAYQTNLTDTTYNGWTNYETWNVALYIQNDEGLYNACREMSDYQEVVNLMREVGSKETPDGVKWSSKKINRIELNEMLKDL
jgi:hypothetical protein